MFIFSFQFSVFFQEQRKKREEKNEKREKKKGGAAHTSPSPSPSPSFVSLMTGTGILLRRAQSGLRRARKWAAVTGTTMEEDWTQLAEVCPLPTFRTLPSEQLKYNQKKSSSKSLHLEERKDDPAASLELEPIIPTEFKLESNPNQTKAGEGHAQEGGGVVKALQEAEELILRKALDRTRT